VPQEPSGAAADLLIEAARAGVNMGARDEVLVLAGGARDMARELGDWVRELHAEIVTTDARLMADTGFSTREARALVERAAAVFESAGEGERLFDALMAITETYHHEGHWDRMDEALRRAEAIARDLGDEKREREAATARLGCTFWGAEPATSGLVLCEQTLQRWPSSPLVRERVLQVSARLLGLLGRFEEANRVAADWLAQAEGLGQRLSLSTRAFTTGLIAELQGDLEQAESEIAWSIAQLEDSGQRGLVATLAGFQSVVLGGLGRWDEAARAAAKARDQSHPDDLDSEAFWRRAEARLMAHRGDLGGALALQREAIEIIDRCDESLFQADARMDLAGLLERAGDPAGAAAAVEQALARYRAKEVVSRMDAAQERLANLRRRADVRDLPLQGQGADDPKAVQGGEALAAELGGRAVAVAAGGPEVEDAASPVAVVPGIERRDGKRRLLRLGRVTEAQAKVERRPVARLPLHDLVPLLDQGCHRSHATAADAAEGAVASAG
jgi:hypothetical protein